MAGSILGNRVQRTEDPALLTGGGTYVYDLDITDVAHVYFVRSIEAHARIASIDISEAETAPGVIAVLTADTLDVAPHHGFVKVADPFAHTPLAGEVVRYVGDPVAMVVAETLAQAIDAAELVVVDYETLPVIVDPEAALVDDTTIIFDAKGDNVAISSADPAGDVLAGAERIIRGRYVNQRVAAVPLEPNSAAAIPGGWAVSDDDRLTFYAANQMPHMIQGQLAGALGMSADEIHVITPDVGGGFGAKAGLCHENSALAAAAIALDRALTWTEVRSSDMVALVHSRAQIQYCELGCSADGIFSGLRVRLVGDAGAYPNVGALLPAGTRRMSNATYNFDAIRFDLAVGITNTTPTGAYRGAGRPEAT